MTSSSVSRAAVLAALLAASATAPAADERLIRQYGVGFRSAIALDPTGGSFVTCNRGAVYRWDLETGEVLVEHSGLIDYADRMALTADGKRMVTNGGPLTLWDLEAGEAIRSYDYFGISPYSVAVSPDGNQVAAGYYNWRARVWDSETANLRFDVLSIQNGVLDIALSPDGQTLLTSNKEVRFWDWPTSRLLVEPTAHAGRDVSPVYSADGTRLVTGGLEDGTAILWDTDGPSKLATFTGTHTGGVASVALSPDKTRVATASLDRTFAIWDAATATVRTRVLAHSQGLDYIAFTPDGTQLLTASTDGTTKLWNAETGAYIREYTVSSPPQFSVATAPDGLTFVTTSLRGAVVVRNVATGEEVRRFTGHAGDVLECVFSPDGSLLATCGADGTARLWEVATGDELQRVFHTTTIRAVALAPDTSSIFTAADDGTIREWETATGELQRQFLGHGQEVLDLSVSADGTRLASISRSSVRLWDLASGKQLLTLVPANLGRAVALSADGSRLLATTASTAILWNDQGELLFNLPGTGPDAAAFSGDGSRVAISTGNWGVRLFSAETGLLQGIFPDTWPVNDLAFGPTGLDMFTASIGGTVRRWRISDLDPPPVAEAVADALVDGAAAEGLDGNFDEVLDAADLVLEALATPALIARAAPPA